MRTFAEWSAEGRAVRKGEKAQHYRVKPDHSAAVALFTEDQTDKLHDEAQQGWITMPAEEWLTLRGPRRDLRPSIKLTEHDGLLTVWVGNNKKAIGMLKSGGYVFDMRTHRWRARGKDLTKVRTAFESIDYRVEVTSGQA